MAALPLPNIGSNQKSSAIVIFDVTRHIFDIPKCDVRSAGSCDCRERLPICLRALRNHVAVVDQMQIHRVVRGGMVTVTRPVVDAFEDSAEELQVLKALTGGQILPRGEIERETGLSRVCALAALLDRGVIVRHGVGRATTYERAS